MTTDRALALVRFFGSLQVVDGFVRVPRVIYSRTRSGAYLSRSVCDDEINGVCRVFGSFERNGNRSFDNENPEPWRQLYRQGLVTFNGDAQAIVPHGGPVT